jgi:hypothetical protein
MIIKRIFLFLSLAGAAVLLMFYIYENRRPGYVRLSAAEKERCAGILKDEILPPVKYLAEKVRSHDVVILGEPHRVSEHYRFLAGALAEAKRAGAVCLAMELFSLPSQADIDRLMRSSRFDGALARRIVLRAFPGFFYEELFLVLKKAWEVNERLGRFDVLALGGGGDRGMADRVAARAAGGKVLVYSGMHHAFSGYYQPGLSQLLGNEYSTLDSRMGQYLRHRQGLDVFTVALHNAFPKKWFLFGGFFLYRKPYVLPFSGVLDQVLPMCGNEAGFDTAAADLRGAIDDFSYYSAGYSPLRLKDYSDGYVFLGPIEEYTDPKPLESLGGGDDLHVIKASIDYYFPPDRRAKINARLKEIYSTRDPASFVAADGLSAADFSRMLDRRGLERK